MTTDSHSSQPDRPADRVDGRQSREPEAVPVWLHDFPHTSYGEENITRRAFTRYLIAGSGAFAAASVGAATFTSLRDLPDGDATAILPVADLPEGTSHLFRYPGPDDPAIVLHLATGIVAYSQKCTHLGCVVFWEEQDEELVCPCHEGIFEPTTGDPIAGPPERPLPRIAVEVRGGTIWALRIER